MARNRSSKPASPAPETFSRTPPPPPPATDPGGKLGTLVALLRRPEGATLASLAAASGWKPHSVRGALAGALKARGHVVSSTKTDGVRVYRLPSLADGEAAS